jgi:hypothetical protein
MSSILFLDSFVTYVKTDRANDDCTISLCLTKHTTDHESTDVELLGELVDADVALGVELDDLTVALFVLGMDGGPSSLLALGYCEIVLN